MFSGAKHLCLLLHSAIATLLLVSSVNAQIQPVCQPNSNSSAALFITADCVDELYNKPIIDSQTNHTEPVPHLQVAGHFYNTTTRFNFYLPPKSNWGGRFYQFVYPTQTEDVEIEHITFGVDSQAYVVQVTGATGYRHEAAAAKFSRVVAQSYYQSEDHIYGYIYGGSGGSFQTVGALENTAGIWDGGLPMLQGIPISAPNGFSARSLFGHVLHPKMTQIQDALKPGGSGNPFESLNDIEKDILHQATLFGIPLRSWEDFDHVGNRSVLSVQEPFVESVDPTFSQDFWTKPGYLGTESGELGDILRGSLVEFEATILGIQRDSENIPIALELSNATRSSREQYDGWSFDISVSSANGTELGKLRGQLNETTRVVSLQGIGLINEVEVLNNLTEGMNVAVSNRDFVALHAFYRHQVPDRAGFIGFDQYRNTANGSATFPQRPMDASKALSEAICGGCTHTGRINAKTIVVQNLVDSDAFPWFADWYRSQIQQTLGEKALEESYRVYYNDHGDHTYNDPPKSRSGFIVNFNGIYEQAMRDLNAWVERGVAPPPSTNYSITSENLVRVPGNAAERAGIQPVAHLNIVGNNCTSGHATGDAVTYSTYTAAVGEQLLFSAHIEVPPGTGKIIDLEWDLFGTMDYVSSFDEEPNAVMDVTKPHSYTEPGNYTVALRVTSQREGRKDTAFARVRNLVRMHVKVQ